MSKVTVTSQIAALAAAMLLVLPVQASAQSQQSGREDNIWGGRDHQPTQSDVNQEEKAAGVAPPQQNQQQTTDKVESLYQNLIQGGKRSP
jgi:hypothetical protein